MTKIITRKAIPKEENNHQTPLSMHPHHLAKDLRDRLSSVVTKSKNVNEKLQAIRINTKNLDESTKQAILQELQELHVLMTNLIGDTNRTIRNAKALTKHSHNRADKVSLHGLQGDIQGNAIKLIAFLQEQLNSINIIISNLGIVGGNRTASQIIEQLDGYKTEYQQLKKSFAQIEAFGRSDTIQIPERPTPDAAEALIAGLILFTGLLAKMLQKYRNKL